MLRLRNYALLEFKLTLKSLCLSHLACCAEAIREWAEADRRGCLAPNQQPRDETDADCS